TSTSFLVESILAEAGTRTGLIGTVEVRFGDVVQRAVNTTPESLDLQRTLRAMVTGGVETAVMEVSSHGLALGRVDGCRFAVAAVTNLSQDHLDFHPSMEDYAEAKALLFRRHLAPEGSAVVLLDDPSAPIFLRAASEADARLVRVTRRPELEAEVRVVSAEVAMDGSRVQLELPDGPRELLLPLIGDFNVENLVVAAGIAVALGLPGDAIARGAARCRQVPGRVERVVGEEDAPTVIVDYAHTPDAIDKLLATLRPLARGRLIAVFGCGGDRDPTKRAPMAEAVARHCDRAVATSDNPRTEDPAQILEDVVKGLDSLTRCEADALDGTDHGYAVLADRREAIACAISIARPEDMVVLAGKGHEDYQILGTEKLPFDDREEAARALARRAS
ncbi:MAG: UDP-N-acetylmuramoyl-L-alanyl-D-glutamate--2,6-diaminopimelate ligase, partial [Deltaproteobacteria bacterium]|nr:UDP-N-acetylmuramoyl-L-alanyl-D-glutamate--2,6-diaminopimelate ligase [Deltaproteobacteria bacterium]